MEDLEKFMYSLHCSQISWEELCQMYLNKQAENEKLKQKVEELEAGLKEWVDMNARGLGNHLTE